LKDKKKAGVREEGAPEETVILFLFLIFEV
jgi:hypothetical protein